MKVKKRRLRQEHARVSNKRKNKKFVKPQPVSQNHSSKSRKPANDNERPTEFSKPSLGPKEKRLIEAVERGASFKEVEGSFPRSRLSSMLLNINTHRPDILKQIYGTPLLEGKIIADECLSHEIGLALHQFGEVNHMYCIGRGMLDRDLAPEMSRKGFKFIFTKDKAGKKKNDDLCEIIKAAHSKKSEALRRKFNITNLPRVIVLPSGSVKPLRYLEVYRQQILDFMNQPSAGPILNLTQFSGKARDMKRSRYVEQEVEELNA